MSTEQTPGKIYPAAIALSVLAAIVCILDAPALIWHARNRNIAAASLMSWIVITNLISLVNAIIWPNDELQTWFSGVGFCDIQIKIAVGRSTALPGATFCLSLIHI